jgi:ATP-dependent DNA helicase RecQ
VTRPVTRRAEADLWPTLLRLARNRFDVGRLRPGQREIIDRVLAGADTLGILPTGAGKSLCFQLPALVIDGLTVVVSPLLALMKDQRDKLDAANVPVAKLDSTLTDREDVATAQAISAGLYEIVYVTPERLENPEYLELLRQRKVALLVVDEAHCVSQWGHDFRPAYLTVRDAIRRLGRPPVLALTATAPPDVAQDILEQLGIKGAAVINTGIERPGLALQVFRTVTDSLKRERLLQLLNDEPGAVIIYAATIRAVEELHAELMAAGLKAARYHGRLGKRPREEAQTAFMDGSRRIMVATKAFGLGIDKPDVRLVVHYNFPDSLESYYQEAGRAGRDGRPARAVLLYQVEDRRIQSFFLGGKYPHRSDIRAVLECLARQPQDPGAPAGMSLKALADGAAVAPRKTQVIVSLLDSVGLVRRVGRGRRIVRTESNAIEADLERAERFYDERGNADRERLDTLMHYAQSPRCRMMFLREYFGEPPGEPCGRCDNCEVSATSNRRAELELMASQRG